MTEAQLQLLRRLAEQGKAADMDVALGSNVLSALLDAVTTQRSALKQLCYACLNGGTRYAPEWDIAAKLAGVLAICDQCSGDGDVEAPRGYFIDRMACPKCKGLGELIRW